MFATDSFVTAELAYRRQKVSRDWRSIRRTRAAEDVSASTGR